jgi:hypothetical protein
MKISRLISHYILIDEMDNERARGDEDPIKTQW